MDGTGIFITGTDTGVGKTVVTGLLARFLSENGYRTATQKWVQTGSNGTPEDIMTHLELMGGDGKNIPGGASCAAPYVLGFAASPHLAARRENISIDAEKIKNAFFSLMKVSDIVLAEGTGGLMVPIDENTLIIDVCREMRLPVLIVAANRLGAINQTILTIEALKRREMDIVGVIFNGVSDAENEIVINDNPIIVNKITGVDILGDLPYEANIALLYNGFMPIGERILNLFLRASKLSARKRGSDLKQYGLLRRSSRLRLAAADTSLLAMRSGDQNEKRRINKKRS